MLNLLGIAGNSWAEFVESTNRLVDTQESTKACNQPDDYEESKARLLARVTGLFIFHARKSRQSAIGTCRKSGELRTDELHALAGTLTTWASMTDLTSTSLACRW